MALVLNEEQVMLQESARTFLQSRAPVSQLRKLRDEDSQSGFSTEIWEEMVSMGWAAIVVPEQYGGLGFGNGGLGIVLEEAGRTLTSSPLMASSLMGVAALLKAGSEEQKTQVLEAICSGETIITLAMDENAQHSPETVNTKAERTQDGYVLNGKKRYVLEGMSADRLIVSARTSGAESDPAGITLFLLPTDLAGVEISRCQALDTHVLADISLSNVQLGQDAVLGRENEGYATLEYALDAGRIGQSAELLGVAIETFSRSLAYLKERKQFGVLIGSFQALQHRAALLFGEIELCKSLVLSALQKLDSNESGLGECASMTKSKLAETAMKVAEEAIQIHGGIGMTDEFDLGFFYKRARILEQLFGDRQYHLDRFARLRGY
jgi:alkylation response protein AidB-like acyl-CoA dehydrogenase